jgi:ERCC4-related helicase/dsRNA-specific ribonuclease
VAKNRNTIVFLETGLGKTYISVLLIKHLYSEPIEANYFNKIQYKKSSNKKVLFLFKTISLLLQQSKVLKFNTNLRILKLYGGQDSSNTPPFGKFKSLLEKYDIICATPETIYRYFTFGYLKSEDVGLVVLDECHHAKDKDFYNLILKHFLHAKNPDEVRILGLTASPSFDNEKTEEKITENIQNLCSNMNCYLACPSNIIKDAPYGENEKNETPTQNTNFDKSLNFLLIDKFSNEIITQTLQIKNFLFKDIILPILIKYLKLKESTTFNFNNETFEPLLYSALFLTLLSEEDKIPEKQIGIFDKEDYEILKKNFQDFNLADAYKEYLDKFKSEAEKIDNDKVNFSKEIREFYKKTQEDYVVDEIRKFVKNSNLILKYIDLDSALVYTGFLVNNIKSYFFQVHHKNEETIEQALIKIESLKKSGNTFKSCYLRSLEEFFSKIISDLEEKKLDPSQNPKSIVFVNHRLITKLLSDKMNSFLNKINYSSRYVLGCQSNSHVPFSEEDLKRNIDHFTFDSNCLVLFATNVVEEGIDIPQCNNVINLSEIKTIKEYIQKTGRARKADSKVFLCCDLSEVDMNRDKIDRIKLSIKVMKKIILENKLKPKLKKEKYLPNLNYYETSKGARVYLSYAKKMVEEFVGKLFYDGYTFLRAMMKIGEVQDSLGKIKYRPYLSLPYVLESAFSQIYDHPDITFSTREEARKYGEKYEDYYYLKAVRLLHQNDYFNDHLLFAKNYDDLMSVENNCSKFSAEPQLRIKTFNEHKEGQLENSNELNKSTTNEEVGVIAHILDISPNYIDINFDNPDLSSQKLIAVLSDSPLTLINFDLFIPSTLLLKLYHFNTAFDDSEENKERFSKKPKILYNLFTKINVTMNHYQEIKVKQEDLPLVNFLYTYLLFTSTDAELFFYYSVFTNKFDFSEKLFLSDNKTKSALEFIFNKYSENNQEGKRHIEDFKKCNLKYSSHVVKFCVVNRDEKGKLFFDFTYIKKLVKSVKEDIDTYRRFLKECVEGEDNIKRMLIEPEYLEEKETKLSEKRNDVDSPVCGTLSRNMINFGKLFIMNYGHTDIRGTTIYKGKQNYQKYFLEKYGVLTESHRDYKKCLPLDYNQKVLKYKVNIGNVGRVARKFQKTHYLKRFNFLPNEVLQSINYFSIDQLHLFTLFPVILYKIQHSLIYYYQAYCLRNSFKTFSMLEQIDMRLLTQSLNSRSTLEQENYERLEFLGDSVLKFLSSFEVFKLYPHGNRDLLYSKRRQIESNKNLFNHAIEEKNQLDKFLFTTPMTIRKVRIPGFNRDETLVFNIGYNKAFAKSCFFNRQSEKKIESNEEIFNGINMKDFKMDIYSEINLDIGNSKGKNRDEEITEKTVINIDYDGNEEPQYDNCELLVDEKLINDVVQNKIEITQPDCFRILYHKVLADLLESLTGFLLHTTLYNENSLYNLFDKPSNFLKEVGVLQHNFNEYLEKPFWSENLINENCRFKPEQKYLKVRPIAENGRYKFENLDLLYQACTHSSYLTEDSMKSNFPYVKKSYQRLAFIGEAFVSFYVSLWVYQMHKDANECLLHKLKICGINHHITSLIAIDLHLDDCILCFDKDINSDVLIYKTKFLESRTELENRFKIPNENVLDDNFIIILCEMFHAYIGAILLDSRSVEKTFLVLKDIMDEYLLNNATLETYTEHPKVVILDEFFKRRIYFKKIREK